MQQTMERTLRDVLESRRHCISGIADVGCRKLADSLRSYLGRVATCMLCSNKLSDDAVDSYLMRRLNGRLFMLSSVLLGYGKEQVKRDVWMRMRYRTNLGVVKRTEDIRDIDRMFETMVEDALFEVAVSIAVVLKGAGFLSIERKHIQQLWGIDAKLDTILLVCNWILPDWENTFVRWVNSVLGGMVIVK